ncbi:hypothetical protein OM960_21955 [Defluviimonas sp. CAU 1641]|uniref:Ca2+-binding protein, RTX toxin-related n=2 Tax=Defluviimonas salinarum TaxID=2992147 RepID=A0ABT3J957_9RHOB|nr:hypothetical protein [Defluviimonas salinarum]
MSLPTSEQVISAFLYGSLTPPSNLDMESLTEDRADYPFTETSYEDYMDLTTGPGRFALGANFEVVQAFFNFGLALYDSGALDDFKDASGEASIPKEDFRLILDEYIGGFTRIYITLQQADYEDGYDDYGYRSLIWGSTAFKISNDAKFIVGADGELRIENFYVEPHLQQDFDWVGGSEAINLASEGLAFAIDPSGTGVRVALPIEKGSPQYAVTYTEQDYLAEIDVMSGWTGSLGFRTITAINSVISDLWNSGVIKFLDGNKPIIYGSDGDDVVVASATSFMLNTMTETYDISDESAPVYYNILGVNVPVGSIPGFLHNYVSNGITYLTGAGSDTIVGSEFDDKVRAGTGNDTIWASLGSDEIRGGADSDVVIYDSPPPEGFFEALADLLFGSSFGPLQAEVRGDTISPGGAPHFVVTNQPLSEDNPVPTAIWTDDIREVETLVLSTHSDILRLKDTLADYAGTKIHDGGSEDSSGISVPLVPYAENEITQAFVRGDVVSVEDLGGSGTIRIDLDDAYDRFSTDAGAGYVERDGSHILIFGFDDVFGSVGRDEIIGSKASNMLFGFGGDDLLIGGRATDLLDGGDGDDVLYGGVWPGVAQDGQEADPTDYEDDGVRDNLVGGAGFEKYYASAFDVIMDATIHAVDEAAAAGPAAGEEYARFFADGDGEVYFDGRQLGEAERVDKDAWDRYPPTVTIAIESQIDLFVVMDPTAGPLLYRVMKAHTRASDGRLVSEYLLIVEDPNARTALSISGVRYDPGTGPGTGTIDGLVSGASAQMASLAFDATMSATSPSSSSVPEMDADAFIAALAAEAAERAPYAGLADASLSLIAKPERTSSQKSSANGNVSGQTFIADGHDQRSTEPQLTEASTTMSLAAATTTSTGFLGISVVEPDPIPDTEGDDIIKGGKNDDYLVATEGDDKLTGAGGNDTLDGGWGNDTLSGGTGNDTADYRSSPTGIAAWLADGDVVTVGFGKSQWDTLQSIENLIGSGLADQIEGDNGNNLLMGMAGNDVFIVSGGNDTLDGGNGNDLVDFAQITTSNVTIDLGAGTFGGAAAGHTYISIESIRGTGNAAQGDTLIGSDERNDLYGYAGNDLISGAGGGDVLDGGDGADTIDGGAGNDLIEGGAGADSLTGGAGVDVFWFAPGDSGSQPGTWDTITDFSQAEDFIEISTSLGFRWVGTDAFEVGLSAGLPYDLRYEIVGNDTHVMADTDRDGAADLVVVLNGVYALDVADFYDTIVHIKSSDPILGTSGDDVIDGTGYVDVIDGLAGNDTISGHGSGDNISGGDGDDRILGGDGNDTIDGGPGQDTLFGDAGMDEIHGGDGNDTIYSLADDDTLFGEAGDDSLMGGRGNDVLYGGIGNDSLHGETGDDLLFGGDGDDTLYGDSTFEWVEGIRYVSSPGDDTLYGGAGNDQLYGDASDDETPGNDFLYGEDGNDTLSGGLGTNYFDGGAGYDILNLSDNDDTTLPGAGAVVVDMVAGTVTRVDNSMDSFINIEGIETTELNDVVQGDSGNNWIYTAGGDDTLRGGAGNDTLQGGAGDDQHFGEDGDDLIQGSIGADYFDGGTGIDTLDFSYTSVGATFDLGNETVVFVDGFTETARAFENVIGGGGADTLIGTAVANQLSGNGGNDTLYGGAGNDTLQGGDGDDQHFGEDGDDLIQGSLGTDYFDGGNGIDTLDFSYTSVGAAIDLTSETVIFDGGFVETARAFENAIGGGGADTLTGTATANQLSGNGGNDTLNGGAGDDRLTGGTGDDTLYGGSDHDVFVFAPGHGNDTIGDYDVLNDLIEFSGIQFSDLIVTQNGSDVTIDYGSGDMITVLNASAGDFTEPEFRFV